MIQPSSLPITYWPKSFIASGEISIPIRSDTDVVLACQKGRHLAEQAGFLANEQVIIVISISEVAYNMLKYAGCGQVCLRFIRQASQLGLEVVAGDEGSGIADVEQAVQDGHSTNKGLDRACGEPGV